jgi:hypothetical protein
VSRPRAAARGLARCRFRGAAALAGALGLAACSSSAPEAPPPACPAALFLDGAERTTAYRAGAGAEPRPDQLRYIAVLADLTSSCSYFESGGNKGVDVDLTFNLIAERGPALSGVEELTYFVATVGPGRQVRSEHVLNGDLAFAEGEQRAGWTESLTLRLPAVTPAQAKDYMLFIGFKLDDEELQRREQPLLR